MAAGTVYLDVDDEITSAATRIRSSDSPKVGLVVPYGSRISTSRMNFRLLSREAVVNNRRLSIIAGDPATRALAASAGLPVFATVGDYEAALAGPPASIVDDDGPPIAPVAPIAPIAAAEATEGLPASSTNRGARGDAVSDETQAIIVPAAAVGVAATSDRVPMARPVAPGARAATGGAFGRLPVRLAVGRYRIETPVLIGVAAVVLALAVVAVGAYLILPAATITVIPRQVAIGPIPLTVTANPDAPSVDLASAVVPAVRLDVPVDVSDTFTTAGKRTELVAAAGQVVFQSYNTGSENTIASGSVVSTEGGIKFQTTAAVTLARAQIIPGKPTTVLPSSATVGIVAVKPGTAGNVPANAITVVPPGEDPTLTNVRNPDPTAGGARNEFPKINQKDVDTALAALRKKLDDAFTAAVAGGAGAPTATTLFPETATLGDATPTSDPAKLIGQEVATFDLGLSANGTVIAVDATPVKQIAETRLLANVGDGYRLVAGSDHVEQGKPVVSDGVVSFPVTARAVQVRILDPDALRAMVKGQSIDQARTLLEPFGDVAIDAWPAWVSSITGFDSRLTLTIGGQDGNGSGPGSSGGPSGGAPASSTGAASASSPAASASPAPPAMSAAP
jgi:hypothetical protein